MSVLQFTFNVQKYQNIILISTLPPDFIEVYDGPGTLSPVIPNNKKSIYKTSTFQCLVHIWQFYSKNLKNFSKSLKMSIQQSKIKDYYKMHSNSSINLIHLIDRSKLLMAEVDNSFIKLTINKLKYNSYNNPLCTFGGITTFTLINDSFTKVSSNCISYDGFYRYRNMYSTSNKFLIVLYSYKVYGSLKINMTLSTTNCKAVTINTCALQYLCKNLENELCKQFQVERNKTLDLRKVSLRLSVSPGQCFILQMTQKLNKDIGNCNISEITHNSVLESGILINFHVSAYIDGRCKSCILFLMFY